MQYPELVRLSKSSLEEKKKRGEEVPEEIIYRFPNYA